MPGEGGRRTPVQRCAGAVACGGRGAGDDPRTVRSMRGPMHGPACGLALGRAQGTDTRGKV